MSKVNTIFADVEPWQVAAELVLDEVVNARGQPGGVRLVALVRDGRDLDDPVGGHELVLVVVSGDVVEVGELLDVVVQRAILLMGFECHQPVLGHVDLERDLESIF